MSRSWIVLQMMVRMVPDGGKVGFEGMIHLIDERKLIHELYGLPSDIIACNFDKFADFLCVPGEFCYTDDYCTASALNPLAHTGSCINLTNSQFTLNFIYVSVPSPTTYLNNVTPSLPDPPDHTHRTHSNNSNDFFTKGETSPPRRNTSPTFRNPNGDNPERVRSHHEEIRSHSGIYQGSKCVGVFEHG